jgi:hypothetical protein
MHHLILEDSGMNVSAFHKILVISILYCLVV